MISGSASGGHVKRHSLCCRRANIAPTGNEHASTQGPALPIRVSDAFNSCTENSWVTNVPVVQLICTLPTPTSATNVQSHLFGIGVSATTAALHSVKATTARAAQHATTLP